MRACKTIPDLLLILGLTLCFCSIARAGQVATDGTLGPARTLAGPNFSIPARLGQQRGGNLFHSFTIFDLDAGDTATFSGPSSIHNVFARVTGGQSSSIDGTISCTIPNASFYLINPSGVVFGPDAALDVKGSFAVTTADQLALGREGTFNASTPSTSVLKSAAPSAFGFLSSHPAGVGVQSATLGVPAGHALSVVSGPIQIVSGRLVALGGRVNIVAVGSAGQAEFDASAVGSPDQSRADVSTFSALADVSLTQASQISLDGPIGGTVLIDAASLRLDRSAISSTTRGSRHGGDLAVYAADLSFVGGGEIGTNTSGSGRGGDVIVKAQSISIDGSAKPNRFTGIDANASQSGGGGDVSVYTTGLAITGGGQISTTASGSGRGGDVDVVAHTVSIDGSATPALLTGIITQSNPGAAGDTGNLSIQALSVSLTGGGTIGTNSAGTGHGGDATVSARTISIDGSATPTVLTGIVADSNAGTTGGAGNVIVHATDLSITGGGEINILTFGSAHAGDVVVTAQTISIDGAATPMTFTGIGTENDTGGAGNVRIHASDLSLAGGAQISATAFGSGHGGNVSITAGEVSIDGSATPTLLTGIVALSNPGATGGAGNLTLHAANLSITGGGEIDADTFGSGRGGAITVTAHAISIDGAATPAVFTGIVAESGAGATGDSGSIMVRSAHLSVANTGEISSETLGSGRGGDIAVTSHTISIDGSATPSAASLTGITAQCGSGALGDAGNVTVHAAVLSLTGGGTIDASTFGSGHGGDLAVTSHTISIAGSDTVTGMIARSHIGATGDAGDLSVQTTGLSITGGGEIDASTFGSGKGGSISVMAQSILVEGSDTSGADSRIAADSTGGGAAGSVSVSSHSGITLSRGGTIATTSILSGAGDVHVASDGTIVLDGGDISAKAALAAGDVTLSSPLLIQMVHHALVTTVSGTANGGDISINALEVSLRQSGVHADALQGVGGNIAIAADATPGLLSTGPLANVTATGKAGVSGNIENSPANTDIAQSVTALATPLDNGMLTLQPQCGQMIEVSTFLIQGRGSTPDEPGFWDIKFGLEP